MSQTPRYFQDENCEIIPIASKLHVKGNIEKKWARARNDKALLYNARVFDMIV